MSDSPALVVGVPHRADGCARRACIRAAEIAVAQEATPRAGGGEIIARTGARQGVGPR